MTCAACGGAMSTPICGRRTGVWRSSCKSCGLTVRDVEPPSAPPVSDHGGMFVALAAAQVRRTAPGAPLTPFDAKQTATAARNAILRFRHQGRDGKANQVGSE